MSKFDGFGYLELAEVWGIPVDKLNDEKNLSLLQARIRGNGLLDPHPNPQVIKDMRDFLTVLADKDDGYAAPLWCGLLAIEDDFTFRQYFCLLLRAMWI